LVPKSTTLHDLEGSLALCLHSVSNHAPLFFTYLLYLRRPKKSYIIVNNVTITNNSKMCLWL